MSTTVGEDGGEEEPNDDSANEMELEWVHDPELRCGVSLYGDSET